MMLDWIDGVFNLSAISLLISLATILIVSYYLKARNIPHGPTGLPILGYWTFFNENNTHLQLDLLQKKYGDFFTFTVAGQLFVNIGSYKVFRESQIAHPDNFDRFQGFSVGNCAFTAGVSFMNGEGWKICRKFFTQSVKHRGSFAVKESLSGSMYVSINSTIEYLKSIGEQPVNMNQLLIGKCIAIFRETLFGESVSEEKMREINCLFLKLSKFMTSKNMLLTGNLPRYTLLPLKPGYREFRNCAAKIEALLYEVIDEHTSTYDEEHIRDIIDEYIKERNDRRSKGDPTARHFTDKVLMSTLVEIVGGGVFTVSENIAIVLKALLNHPEEQDKIYRELMKVVGVHRQPTIEDKSKLTYTNAFIMEAFRTSDFFPFFPNMECINKTYVRGLTIPKGALTILNKWSAHHDPEVFEEPTKFNPSRFLNADGKKKLERPLTFGIGKRICPGENYAMLHVFLFMTTIIKNFHITLADTSKEISDELLKSGQTMIRVHTRNHGG